MTDVRRGRPRSDQADRAILDATRDLLVSANYERLSIEAIAARAGVGKQTVYRRWASKAAVVAEALLTAQAGLSIAPPHDTGDLARDLKSWVIQHSQWLANPTASVMIRALAAAAADSQIDAAQLYEHLTGPAREAILHRLDLEANRDALRDGTDLDAIVDAIIGTLLYHVLARHPDPRLDLGGLIDILVNGVQNPRLKAPSAADSS
ncbi:DNA-binding transcriptional regulator, AcrR family [Parafrankia irregularis]|uniref:DNA-binding transcriptional regulator, AcrR family n=1 Tax=Parafrankia irregularis TaxID=795642 RepID=A0A0S4QZ83_9ACTN|nr:MULTISPECIES: TetR/AcrR family transcriptional regulator [Parafrankia]MBE3200342.1 TetR/AcrR family transcriptional regulator [Parafrankia sp. CH37]CUU59770.1 DNA-binding transcriptional regulator, AcrR family [Parafrankia irregularis]